MTAIIRLATPHVAAGVQAIYAPVVRETAISFELEPPTVEDMQQHFQHFLVAHEGGKLIGAIGMEPYGLSALLRSLAVAPEYQGHGLGRALVERLLHQAREQGVKQIFLLTETAPEFFPKFGFTCMAREETDAAVQQSVEFRTACCQSADCMRLHL